MSRGRRVLTAATHNASKVREMEAVLGPALEALGVKMRPLDPSTVLPEEKMTTFAGNAALKALAAASDAGQVALGEDSGLEVEALGGAPGVYSARFSGDGPVSNNRLLLEKLEAVGDGSRQACFCCLAALKGPHGPLFLSRGTARGVITREPRGESGFGYDPVFLSHDLGRTFAEAASSEKNRVSHRGRALRALRGYLFEVFDDPDEVPAEVGLATAAGVPGARWCLEALRRLGVPRRLVEHQVVVSRLAREAALRLVEAGHPVNVALVSAAALLHDVAKVLPVNASDDEAGDPGSAPPGVTTHAWHGAEWARRQGLHPALVRAILVHGLDSMVSAEYGPVTWEERVLMLCDKLADVGYAGLETRLADLEARHPGITGLVREAAPELAALRQVVARAVGLRVDDFDAEMRAVLEEVSIFGAAAGAEEVERFATAFPGPGAPSPARRAPAR